MKLRGALVSVGVGLLCWAGAACGQDGGEAPPSDERYALVWTDGFLVVPPPACEEWVGYGCSEIQGCTAEGYRIGIEEGEWCPRCIEESEGDPDTCGAWEESYREFLITNVSGSCANYCDEEVTCSAIEIRNACGTYALPLTGGINEEVIAHAEVFARENCGVCGDVEPSATGLSSTFEGYTSACIEHQCVLVPRTDEWMRDYDAAP